MVECAVLKQKKIKDAKASLCCCVMLLGIIIFQQFLILAHSSLFHHNHHAHSELIEFASGENHLNFQENHSSHSPHSHLENYILQTPRRIVKTTFDGSALSLKINTVVPFLHQSSVKIPASPLAILP